MSEKNIVSYSLDDVRKKIADGEDQTDWARVDAMTDEDIERQMRDDPDWAEWIDVDWSKAVIVMPVTKKSISIRLDEEVIDFFKSTGKGYQTRMNAILRHYVQEKKNKNG